MRLRVDWVQGMEIFAPVERLRILIWRRKGERRIQMDWHPAARMLEPPPCDWGLGLTRRRLVCDEKLHLTEPEGQDPCPACAKAWCRACHAVRCPRCGASPTVT